MGNMKTLAVGFIVVILLIAAWVLAIGIGQSVGSGLSEWLVP